jgi:hypothetical protein
MKRLGLLCLVSILFCALGCASDSSKAEWREFFKDLRGDNMQMRSDMK